MLGGKPATKGKTGEPPLFSFCGHTSSVPLAIKYTVVAKWRSPGDGVECTHKSLKLPNLTDQLHVSKNMHPTLLVVLCYIGSPVPVTFWEIHMKAKCLFHSNDQEGHFLPFHVKAMKCSVMMHLCIASLGFHCLLGCNSETRLCMVVSVVTIFPVKGGSISLNYK